MEKKSRWGIGIVISFVVFAACILTVVYIALSSKVDLVMDDYYEKELKYQQHIDVEKNTKTLGKKVEVSFTASSMNIKFPQISTANNVSGSIMFFRPSDKSKDFTKTIKLDSLFTQSISTEGVPRGMWRVKISWNAANQKYYFEQPIIIQ